MLRSRFLWKLYGGYAIAILVAAGTVGALLASQVERETIAETDRRLVGDAVRLRELITESIDRADPPDALQRRVVNHAEVLGTRWTAIAADGVVLADSEEDPAHMDDHGTRPEVLSARDAGRGASTRFSQTLGMRMRYLALPVHDGERLIAYARAALPLASIQERQARIRRSVVTGALAATLVALALAFLIARRTTRPIRAMTSVAEAMAAGDYDRLVDAPDHRDELGALARAFNTMSRRLGDQLETITVDHARLRAVLASMVEGVVAVDPRERIVHVNQVAADLLQIDSAAALDRPIWEVSRIREVSEVLYEAMEHRQPAHREMRLPGRSDRIIELRAVPLRESANGQRDAVPRGAVLVLEDVTQLRRLETVRQDFVGNVSHELKTPVAAIRGLVETMLDDPEMPADTRRDFLSKVRDQTHRLSTLVTDLLSLSRLDAEQGRLRVEPVDLRRIIDAAARDLQPAIDGHQVTIEIERPEETLPVLGDSEALQEAVSNLLDNAIKYSPAGEIVRVVLRRDGKYADLAVIDRGPGIPHQHQERIFERFYRVDRARSRALGGTGLGLAIVKHIAQDLGGTVAVESEPGAGSTFRIRLPLHGEEGGAAA